METENTKLWCILELFGHQKIAGEIQEIQFAGAGFIRCFVPETQTQPAWSKDIAPSAVYALNFVDEAAARSMAKQLNVAPISRYETREMFKKWQEENQSGTPQIPAYSEYDEDENEF